MPTTPTPGDMAPALTVPLIDGTIWDLHAQAPDAFTMIVVYRSLHCPICKTYLRGLHALHGDFLAKGFAPMVLSMDDAARARQAQAEWELDPMPMGHSLSEADARAWGLFLSRRRKDSEPEIFAEPGLFLVTSAGVLWMVDVANVPFVRPDLSGLLARADMMVENKDQPPRGGD
jgi:peroxiredoxin